MWGMSMADVVFKPNSAGIQEICKSPEMQAALLPLAQKLADEANREAESCHAAFLHIDRFEKPPYAAHVDVLDHTAVGAAHTNGKMGRADFAKFQTLAHVNH